MNTWSFTIPCITVLVQYPETCKQRFVVVLAENKPSLSRSSGKECGGSAKCRFWATARGLMCIREGA
jgi:hypothetical protein